MYCLLCLSFSPTVLFNTIGQCTRDARRARGARFHFFIIMVDLFSRVIPDV
jgi:hypothetical protein